MFAWLIWFHALPVAVRRLMGAVLICGVATGAIAFAVHRYGNHREAAGYQAGWNHAVILETRKQAVIVDSLERRADSVASAARRTDSLLPATPRQHLVIQTQTVPLVRDSLKPELTVRVIVESVHDTVENVPLRAARYWQQSDSIAGLAIHARDEWRSAYAAEHSARIGADSLTSLWRTRALSAQPVAHSMSWQGKVLHAAAWAAVVLVVRNQIH